AAFADFGEDRDFAQETDVLTLGFGATTAVAEDFNALAAGGGEVAHVFDDAKDGNVHLLEHGDAFANDAKRGFLGRGDDDATVEWDGLAQGELGITGAGREINEQIIELAPFDGTEELLNGFHDHGAAPDDRLIAFDEETDAHDFHAVVFER